MKNILIIYPSMMVGGSTTSLLSIMNELNPKEYCVDLLLLNTQGKLIKEVPQYINILPFAFETKNRRVYKIMKLLSLKSDLQLIKGIYFEKIKKKSNVRTQIMHQDIIRYCRRINKKYDVAISFLEMWPLYYLSEMVTADKKIAWIHVNYNEAGLNLELDRSYMKCIDNFVLVSKSCKEAFDKSFFEFSDKSLVIQNILSSKTIKNKARQQLEMDFDGFENCVKFISVCRIVFYHKGLKRGVHALKQLQDEGVDLSNFVWFIVGDGPDYEALKNLVEENKLTNRIILLGEKTNPMPFILRCDVFFLPSYYEGKPMAVTEAQMLCVVPVVTNYSSANEQVENKVDGIIMGNDDNEIKKMLQKVISSPGLLKPLHDNIAIKDYSNIKEFKKIENLLK